jgi:hypothetical protein
MTEHPILFNGEMVRAILKGRKTQTRRVMKSQPYTLRTEGFGYPTKAGGFVSINSPHCLAECPFGIPGDRLWVREALEVVANWGSIHYTADNAICYDPEIMPENALADVFVEHYGNQYEANEAKGVPSIFMPRWASRITLEITDVRVHRLQDISEEDALAEGPGGGACYIGCYDQTSTYWKLPAPIANFARLWDSINLKRCPWSSNPWLWALTFKEVRG